MDFDLGLGLGLDLGLTMLFALLVHLCLNNWIDLITFCRRITSRQGFSGSGIIEDFTPNFKEPIVHILNK